MSIKELSVARIRPILIALSFVILLGLLSQIRILLPFTPVPLTLQTLGLLFAAYYLSLTWSLFSVLLYLSLGALGFPLFSGGKGGLLILSGPTGGYLIGFFFLVYFVSWAKDRGLLQKPLSTFVVSFIGHLLVYLFGVLWFLAGFLPKEISNGPWNVLSLTVLPFLPSDIIKCLIFTSFVYTERMIRRS